MGARLVSWTSLPGTQCCWPRRRTLWESSANLCLPATASWAGPCCLRGWPRMRSVMTPCGLWNHSCTAISHSLVSVTIFKSFRFFPLGRHKDSFLLLVLKLQRGGKACCAPRVSRGVHPWLLELVHRRHGRCSQWVPNVWSPSLQPLIRKLYLVLTHLKAGKIRTKVTLLPRSRRKQPNWPVSTLLWNTLVKPARCPHVRLWEFVAFTWTLTPDFCYSSGIYKFVGQALVAIMGLESTLSESGMRWDISSTSWSNLGSRDFKHLWDSLIESCSRNLFSQIHKALALVLDRIMQGPRSM